MTSTMIVVANRLPFVLKRQEDGTLSRQPSAGGLVTAMAPVVKQRQGVWIGWPGIYLNESDAIPEGNPDSDNAADSLGGKQTIAVNVNPELFDEYYNGCCNATFWPLMHSMPDRVVFNRDYWSAYVKVNEKFASTTFEVLRREVNESPERKAPLVWIHDYQLMLVASLIRRSADEVGISNTKLAFFHHIPFPSWDIFRLFPWQDEVLVGLLGCDLIGFHVDGYVDNFLECCQKGLGCRVDRERHVVQHDGRAIRVQSFPIGVPFQQFEGMARNSTIETYDDKSVKVVLGVDRLDYTKGIVHRVQAFEKLLEHYPEHKEKVHLFQIAVPSRTDVIEYQELKDELDREIGRINGRFSTSRWSPIRYLYRFMKQDELCAFYRDAFVALVTPIRDGMNLVAKEFVACQICEPGVLILSPFTGAGETMHEALITNPLEENCLAECIHRALTMPKKKKVPTATLR